MAWLIVAIHWGRFRDHAAYTGRDAFESFELGRVELLLTFYLLALKLAVSKL